MVLRTNITHQTPLAAAVAPDLLFSINSALIYPAKDRHLKLRSKGFRVLCSLFMTESLSSCIKKLQSSAGTQGDFQCDIKMKSLSVHHF